MKRTLGTILRTFGRSTLVVVTVVLGRLCVLEAGAAEPLTLPNARERVIFEFRTQACGPHDFPDTPARVITRSDGSLLIYGAHHDNRLIEMDPSGQVSRDCRIIYRGNRNPDPARYDDLIWIAALWARDDRTIHALGHNEFHGHARPGACNRRQYWPCWQNSVVPLISRDGGRTFARNGHVSAPPTDRYRPEQDGPTGVFNPSNIIRINGRFIFFARVIYPPRDARVCRFETDDIDNPSGWRALGESGATLPLPDPNLQSELPGERCRHFPVFGFNVSSLLFDPQTNEVLAFFERRLPAVPGFAALHVTRSKDMEAWTTPREVVRYSSAWLQKCAAPLQYAYPSIAARNRSDRNSYVIEQDLLIFLTRFNRQKCDDREGRDLVVIGLNRNDLE
jgi:hypothetical protein